VVTEDRFTALGLPLPSVRVSALGDADEVLADLDQLSKRIFALLQ